VQHEAILPLVDSPPRLGARPAREDARAELVAQEPVAVRLGKGGERRVEDPLDGVGGQPLGLGLRHADGQVAVPHAVVAEVALERAEGDEGVHRPAQGHGVAPLAGPLAVDVDGEEALVAEHVEMVPFAAAQRRVVPRGGERRAVAVEAEAELVVLGHDADVVAEAGAGAVARPAQP